VAISWRHLESSDTTILYSALDTSGSAASEAPPNTGCGWPDRLPCEPGDGGYRINVYYDSSISATQAALEMEQARGILDQLGLTITWTLSGQRDISDPDAAVRRESFSTDTVEARFPGCRSSDFSAFLARAGAPPGGSCRRTAYASPRGTGGRAFTLAHEVAHLLGAEHDCTELNVLEFQCGGVVGVMDDFWWRTVCGAWTVLRDDDAVGAGECFGFWTGSPFSESSRRPRPFITASYAMMLNYGQPARGCVSGCACPSCPQCPTGEEVDQTVLSADCFRMRDAVRYGCVAPILSERSRCEIRSLWDHTCRAQGDGCDPTSETCNLLTGRCEVPAPPEIPQALVTASEGRGCVVRGGRLFCWGTDWAAPVQTTPVEITGFDAAVVDVSADYHHTCAVLADGRVGCWGWTTYGKLGDGTGNPNTEGTLLDPAVRQHPVFALGISDAVQVATGHHHTCSLSRTGHVMCWGWNRAGQLGSGSSASFSMRPELVARLEDAIHVCAGASYTCAVRRTGNVVCWGRGPGVDSALPTEIPGIADAVQVTCSQGGSVEQRTCILQRQGSVLCISDASPENQGIPVRVSGLNDAVWISAGGGFTCATLAGGQVVCWGSNRGGVIADGSTWPSDSSVTTYTSPVAISGITETIQVACGWEHTCALLHTGTVYCWGRPRYYQLGPMGSHSYELPSSWEAVPFRVPY
jgi:hypothetical protein